MAEQFEHFKFIADSGQTPLRVDKFIMNFLENSTRNKIQQLASKGNIKVNGKKVKSNYKVKSNDEVSITYEYPKRDIELIPQKIDLNIFFEDEDLIIVNKRPGLVVHPGFGNYDGTLINGLVYHFKNLPNINDDNRPGLVHRIDKNTTGLLVVAKNEISMKKLSEKFANRDLDRKYIALVWGDLKENEGTIEGNIGRNYKNRKVMDVFPEGDNGKSAITHYRVLERFSYTTLVECKLETGRTHQIRVHFKYLGHPLFNDAEYGGDIILKGTTFTKYRQFINNCFKICPRHALHAKSLAFKHPINNKDLFFDSEIPEDMLLLINKWRNYSVHKKT